MALLSLILMIVSFVRFTNSQRIYDEKMVDGRCESEDDLRVLQLDELTRYRQELENIKKECVNKIENFLTFQEVNITKIQQEELEKLRIENQEIRSQLTLLKKIWNTTKDEPILLQRCCYDLLTRNPSLKGRDGVYDIVVDLKITSVYCDMTTDGGGWTVLQRRIDNSTDFYRTWDEYKYGFGDPKNNYWIGNDAIYELTKNMDQELRVELQSFDGAEAYAQYSTFYVGDEGSKYKLTVSGYSGTAGDSLTYQNGSRFSTKDQENEDWIPMNCATSYHGAWWYKNCAVSNLNGEYAHSALSGSKYPMWYHWKHRREALQKTKMMIRKNV